MSIITTQSDEPSAPMPEIPGYRLRQIINHGGLSTVYLGEQVALGREVAIKIMLPHALADEVSRRRFENEVRTIARLEHPHVVGIHEVGRTREGLPYYAMPFLPRGHLGKRIEQGFARGEAEVISIVEPLLSALEYAHSRGVVHRDVKAENVLFDITERPLLADFGIALRRGFGARMTATGLAVGSTAYMAPEQARGEEVDGRADLYSLGVLCWEMLTGRLPFEAQDALSMAVMHAQNPIPKLPPPLKHWQRFMNRALAKQPDQRFSDAAEMAEAVSEIKHRGELSRFGRVAAQLRPLKRWVTPAWAGLAVVAVAVVSIAFALNRVEKDGFFRAELPAANKSGATRIDNDPTQAMMAPLPQAPLQESLQNARTYIAQGRLASPADANAYNSLLTAWHLDSTSPEVGVVVGELTQAFADEMARDLREGRDQRAREHLVNATALGQQTGTADSAAQRSLREKAAQALETRLEQAARRGDGADAGRVIALAEEFGLPRTVSTRLIAQARGVAGDGTVARGVATIGAAAPASSVAVSFNPRPVSRGEYARFVSANQRAPALCRERASLLRVIAPKDWKAPGFDQNETEPVVCVSTSDAEAYARWYSQQTGRHYRLPTADEAQRMSGGGGRALSIWSGDCGRTCQQRQVGGSSWRSGSALRPLNATRGYDDVGFRLVRER
ncbi:bifunctional serine/threonine-protein kinase/formylglycine-generating enzyme family protein [Lysobacter antibioticus]|uniref:bifunctional serine/threonine-protein kinase/formylglycine-generating enzyme family protein n=1 Tax=Lysobacter antibioticus TaxID=84531 RepID=UPI001378B495|nr:bifunctional serine/threonine-protein kinase/formylglycine-generating enzyme family protein [Lysobacter antibioticus]